MNQRRFVILSIAMGIVVPVLWLAVYWVFLRGDPALIYSVMSNGYFDRVLLAIWPSWIFFVADPDEQSITIPVISIVVNAILYGCLGWLIWFGLHRKRVALGIAAIVILTGWYFLLKWYIGG